MRDGLAHRHHRERRADFGLDNLHQRRVAQLDVACEQVHFHDVLAEVIVDGGKGGTNPERTHHERERVLQNSFLTRMSSAYVASSLRVRIHDTRSVWSYSSRMI